jgi:inner membrane protein
MHSIIFILLVTFFIRIKTKDRLFTAAGFAAIFSHVYLDYATNWKMRPLYPFSTDASIMGSISFLDPLANILPLLPVFIVLVAYMKSRGKWNGKFNKFCTFVTNNRNRFFTALLIVLIIWLTVTPIAKLFFIDHISEAEGTSISYQDTYPSSFGKFLTAYPYNSTHYKILDLGYWSGIERSEYIKKIDVSGNVSNALVYVERAGRLYSTAVPEEIDYPVYNVSEENSSVTVMLSDARDPYVKSWAYFKTVYRFVFDMKSGDYVAYGSIQGRKEKRLGKNYFE